MVDTAIPYTTAPGYSSGADPVGPAGGDLSGTYPDPTVAKINGTALGTLTGAMSGQGLVWNGTDWVDVTIEPSAQMNDLLAWTGDPAQSGQTVILPSVAELFLSRIPLLAPISVTNLVYQLSVIATGSTLTNSFVSLFRSDGTIIGQSADQSAVWGTGGTIGIKTTALVGGPFMCTPLSSNDFLWAAYYVGTTTLILPTFKTANSASAIDFVGTIASRTRYGAIGQANTSTLVSIVPASITQSGSSPYFFALS